MEDFWTSIRKIEKPVVMYGTGDAADKLYTLLEERGVKVRGCFVNDEFVRNRTFHGYKVLSFQDAKRIFGDMAVVLGFGSHRPDVLSDILRVNRETEFYAPDLLMDENGNLLDNVYLEKHKEEIEWAYGLLEDDLSRKVFQTVLETKLTGKIEPLLSSETPELENWKLLDIGRNEAFMDLGAYNGDTIERFLSFTDTYERIIGVEPEGRNFRKLKAKTETLSNCEIHNVGISDRSEVGVFLQGAGRGSHLGEGKATPFDSIDNILKGRRVSILKFDIEGQEPKALRGAEKTIRMWKPKMVLSAYHRIDDLWALPRIITEYRNDYHFFLRHSPAIPAWEVEYYLK